MTDGQQMKMGMKRSVWKMTVAGAAALAIAGMGAGCAGASAAATVTQSKPAPAVAPFSKGTVRGVSENEAGNGVSTAKASTIAKYAKKGSVSDTDNLKSLFKALPLGDSAADVTVADGGAVTVQYKGVNHLINGNAIVTALTYNAMSTFAAFPDAQTVTLSVLMDNEPETTAYATDPYIFTRADVEAGVGQALNSQLLSNGTWQQLKGKTVNDGIWVNGIAGAARKAGYTAQNPKK